MKKFAVLLSALFCLAHGQAFAQIRDSLISIVGNDTLAFWAQAPANYSRDRPPALFFYWHHFGEDYHAFAQNTIFEDLCNQRGWVAATFTGPYAGRHYQCPRGLDHAQLALDWVMRNFPFCPDSIYMVGGSMGGAGGQVWNNNNCGVHDYMCAATYGASPILDCMLRQQQYLDSGHVLVAMQTIFGGLPGISPAVDFEYYRSSAVRLSDTTKSMHFNSLHLPVYNTWGTTDSTWSAEWFAYGRPAQYLDTLRRAGGADTTVTVCSGINGHGYSIMIPDSVISWLGGFRLNRFPLNLSINADNNDEYYWSKVQLNDTLYNFGRYGVTRNEAQQTLDISLIRNVKLLEVEFLFPWTHWDTLSGNWINFDSAVVQSPTIVFTGVPRVIGVTCNNVHTIFTSSHDTLSLNLTRGGHYKVTFETDDVPTHSAAVPNGIHLRTAYPNPFNSQITLEIESSLSGMRTLQLFDITGRLAKTIAVNLQPGTQRLTVSSEDIASGVYFASLTGLSAQPLKIVLIK
jgi:hypothetical protein